MEGGSTASGGKDAVVGLLLGAVSNASLAERSLELLLVLGRLGAAKDGAVAQAGDVVGLADHGDLVLVLDDAGDFNGRLDGRDVPVGEASEVDVVGDLAVDGVDGGLRVGAGDLGEGRVDLGRGADFVDVVLLQGILGGGRQAGPDDVFGVDGGDEEGRLVGLGVVDEVAVGEVAAGEVEKVAALAIGIGGGWVSLRCCEVRVIPASQWKRTKRTGSARGHHCPLASWYGGPRGR